MVHGGSTVVEHSPRHQKCKGLSPYTNAGIGREKIVKNLNLKTFENVKLNQYWYMEEAQW
jgi:hypothetical protein